MASDDRMSLKSREFYVDEEDALGTPDGIRIADNFDREMLSRAVRDAGQWAYGAILVEVWVMNATRTKLFRPVTGHWVDQSVAQVQLERFVNPKHEKFLDAIPLSPGVGIPGLLWNESHMENPNRKLRNSFKAGSFDGGRMSSIRQISTQGTAGDGNPGVGRRVVWRDIACISSDPDQPRNARLDGLVEAGIGWAAGISFDIGGEQGVVIYMARKGVDLKKLMKKTNEEYLKSAADLIGSVWSLRRPRHEAVEARKRDRKVLIAHIRNKLFAALRAGYTLNELVEGPVSAVEGGPPKLPVEPKEEEKKGAVPYVQFKFKQWATKPVHGGGSQPPPPKSTLESLFSACGIFLTILIVAQLNLHFQRTYGDDYRIALGPFGALAILHYSLTPAPASQPRSCFFAQVVGLTIAVGLNQIAPSLDLYIRQALATSIMGFINARLGIIHPPAGAAAIIFSGTQWKWSNMLTFLATYSPFVSSRIRD